MSPLEKPRSGAQLREAVLAFLAEKTESLSRQGYVIETWRTRGGRRFGPYYRLRYREGQTQRSLYLGGSAELAEEVRGRLRELQRPQTERLQWAALLRRQRTHGRRLKTTLEHELAKIVQLKGFEIRGLRQSPLGHGPPGLASSSAHAVEPINHIRYDKGQLCGSAPESHGCTES